MKKLSAARLIVRAFLISLAVSAAIMTAAGIVYKDSIYKITSAVAAMADEESAELYRGETGELYS